MYDLVVIGGGSAGFSAAMTAANLNKKVTKKPRNALNIGTIAAMARVP